MCVRGNAEFVGGGPEKGDWPPANGELFAPAKGGLLIPENGELFVPVAGVVAGAVPTPGWPFIPPIPSPGDCCWYGLMPACAARPDPLPVGAVPKNGLLDVAGWALAVGCWGWKFCWGWGWLWGWLWG